MKSLIFSLMLVSAFVSVSSLNIAAAVDCDSYAEAAPSPIQILCPVFKVANLGFKMVGVVLLIMITLGAIKLATSLGDPKGLDAASRTWTYALIGTGVVIGAVTIVSIISKLFGLNFGGTENIFSSASLALERFLALMGIQVN